MKAPRVSCILISHQKAVFVKQAIYSVLGQTLRDWRLLVIDSGPLFEAGLFEEFRKLSNGRITIGSSGETPGEGRTCNMHSRLVNRLLRDGSITGQLIFLLCDDDLFYPWAFQSFYDYWQQHEFRPWSMYASIHLGRADERGNTEFIGERIADVPRGAAARGPGLDCQVDYLQFCFTQRALARYRAVHGDEILSESRRDASHADGIFMDRMGALETVERVGYFVGMNRRTPHSLNGK